MSVSINGTGGITFADASTQSTGGYTGFRNRIINGAMTIDQRNAGAGYATTTLASADFYCLDRWKVTGTQNSKFTIQQNAGSVTPPVGFSNYLGVTSSSAYSVGSGDLFVILQNVEGFNTADLGWGTINAKTVTLSFQVYSSLTGTFGGSLENSAYARSYPFTYSIPVANTWTTISVVIQGDTSGTWVGATNGIGLRVNFGLGCGSTYSGAAGSWASADYKSATGATSVVGTLGATFYITGVQLEKGSVATPFEFRPYGTELALCQRYYQTPPSNPLIMGFYSGSAGGSNTFRVANIPLSPPMRATPTGSVTGQNTGSDWYFNNVSPTNMQVAVNIGSSSGEYNVTAWSASAEL